VGRGAVGSCGRRAAGAAGGGPAQARINKKGWRRIAPPTTISFALAGAAGRDRNRRPGPEPAGAARQGRSRSPGRNHTRAGTVGPGRSHRTGPGPSARAGDIVQVGSQQAGPETSARAGDIGRGLRRTAQPNSPAPNSGANTSATMDISLIKMLSDGPDVSLNGSPTVSPTTAAAWASLPLPPWAPLSMCFLALSQAPPALAIIKASGTPVTSAPASMPPRASLPRMSPTARGMTTARTPGRIIS